MEPILEKVSERWPVLVQAATWTILLTFTVALASFAPEMAFVSQISSSDGFVKIPMEDEMVMVPSEMVKKSTFDVFVPTIFAGVMVVASVSLLRSCLGIEGVVEMEQEQC
ncbi:hypothetical protein CARUB_v10024585mg [Capsella rubella]|uniref:Uncharacterized protein n=1 Tax=Capsella rubella TaxID=81985 RepID=R0HSM9_9BRAS|nr:uncharacterized protein LOC17890189 [Capsella rubella]EOA28380.1 hypothetical protein CARUB_v10024585mg [Capsella rubella]